MQLLAISDLHLSQTSNKEALIKIFKRLNLKYTYFNLPLKKYRLTLNKSPHVNKKAKEHFEVFYYQVLITIKEPISLEKIKYLLNL